MAKQDRYAELADKIVDLLGGKSNISYFTHCVTRLRFNVKDKGLVQAEGIEKLPGVMGDQWSGDQYQVIIGQDVADAYRLICDCTGLSGATDEDDVSAPSSTPIKRTPGAIVSAIFDAIAGCVAPCIPVLIGGGMVQVLLLVATQLGLLTAEDPTYVTFNFVANAPFYFLPVLVGANAARKFGANMAIGMTLGAVLLHPTFVAMVAEGSGGSVFGLPIPAETYSSNVFAMVITMWVAARVERVVAKFLPDILRSILEPLVTLVIMTPLMLCLLAPLGAMVGNYLTAGLVWLYDTLGFIGLGIFTAVVPIFVMSGMHMAFPAVAMQNFASLGYDPLICIASMLSNFNQGAACLAVAVRSRGAAVKATASSAAVSAIVAGVSEPALFGITLKYKTPLYAVMIGNFVGAAIAGIFQCCCYAFPGSFALFGMVTLMGDKGMMNLVYMAIAVVVGMVATFVAALILYKPQAIED